MIDFSEFPSRVVEKEPIVLWHCGAEFDKEFLAAVVSGHKTCVDNFVAESKEAKNNDLRMWVDKITPTLKNHLARAEELHSR
jgi:predicted outer membrane protein